MKKSRGRPKKQPEYDKSQVIEELLSTVVALYGEPYDDRKERPEDAPSIRTVAEEMHSTTLRIRKLLITANYFSTALSRQVQAMYESGRSISEIMIETELSRASVHGYLPYMEGAYKLRNPGMKAEQARIYRVRKKASEQLREYYSSEDAEYFLWKALGTFAEFPFHTEDGKLLKYKIENDEMIFSRGGVIIPKDRIFTAFRDICNDGDSFGLSEREKHFLNIVFLRIGAYS